MKKTARFLISICAVVSILLSCSCKVSNKIWERQENYGPTVDFFLHPEGGGKYDGWRFVYDREKNKVIPLSQENIIMGASYSSYLDSKYAEQIKIAEDNNELGQCNDYICFDDIEMLLYWNWGSENMNTLLTIQNGNIDLIDIGRGNHFKFSYYDSDSKTVYLQDYLTWNDEFTKCSANIYKVDLKSNSVTKENVCVYNEEIDQKFNISSQMKYPVSAWEKSSTNKLASLCLIPDDDDIMMCATFSPFINGLGTWFNMNVLIKYSTASKQPEAVTVLNETVCKFQKKDDGYITFSEHINKTGTRAYDSVERLWITRYDNNLTPLETTEIKSERFGECNSLLVYSAGNDAFITGENGSALSNFLAYYNMSTGEISYADDMPSGFVMNYRLIQKTDGKIKNIQ